MDWANEAAWRSIDNVANQVDLGRYCQLHSNLDHLTIDSSFASFARVYFQEVLFLQDMKYWFRLSHFIK